MYYGYHFFGMHLVWWLLWVGFLIWIFMTPFPIPGENRQKDSSLEILKRRLAQGEIDTDEYEALKEKLEEVK